MFEVPPRCAGGVMANITFKERVQVGALLLEAVLGSRVSGFGFQVGVLLHEAHIGHHSRPEPVPSTPRHNSLTSRSGGRSA